MVIQGFINPTHAIRQFLVCEYAFDISYSDHIVRIAHRKGTWFLAKAECCPMKVLDFIEIDDCCTGARSKNAMTLALYEQLVENELERKTSLGTTREEDAKIIEKFLRFWGGKTSSIIAITAVQPGRNASVDDLTGEFHLSPRENEFKK